VPAYKLQVFKYRYLNLMAHYIGEPVLARETDQRFVYESVGDGIRVQLVVWKSRAALDRYLEGELEEMALYIRKILREKFGEKPQKAVKIIYGGSVNAENVQNLMVPGVDGFLPGRASASKETLKELIAALDA